VEVNNGQKKPEFFSEELEQLQRRSRKLFPHWARARKEGGKKNRKKHGGEKTVENTEGSPLRSILREGAGRSVKGAEEGPY